MNNKTNILIIDQALDFGGSIVSAANLIRGMDKDQYKIVFCSSTNKGLINSKLREDASTTPVYILRKAINYGNVDKILPYRNLQQPGLKARLLKVFSYAIRILAHLPFMLKVGWILIYHRIDLLQINNGIDDELCLVAKILRRPIVGYFRGYQKMSNLQRKYFVHRFKYFFSVSEFIKQVAVEDGIPEEKIIVATPPAIPEPINHALVKQLRNQYQTNSNTIFIGIFGRLTPWKGQKEFLLAASNLLKSYDNVLFFIIGEVTDSSDSYYAEIKTILKTSGITDKVVFTGYIDNVYDYYELMDIVVHASIKPEPSGRVIFEAMSQSKPVIASPYGGPTEFVIDGVDGLIADPLNQSDLCDKMLTLCQNPTLRSNFGKIAKQKMDKYFNKNVYAEKMSTYYKKSIT